MEKDYILSIDQSTSGTKGIIWNSSANIIDKYHIEHKQYYPKPGWVEHDPEEIFKNTLIVINTLINKNNFLLEKIAALAITNQRETVVVWDKDSGKPIYNAVVWQCQRGVNICNEIYKKGLAKTIRNKTGLILSPYFSASKIKWILDNVKDAREKAKEGKLLCGTIDTWLIWKLTKGKVHATDYSNASRTQLFNINELKWDEEILEIFDIPPCMLPEVRFSDEIFGFTEKDTGINLSVPISGVIGDSHAALFGQSCFEVGTVKATYGTGSSVMMNIGEKYIEPQNGLVTSIAWGAFDKIEYVFEGNINFTGATIKWIVDNLKLISDSSLSGEIASSLEDNDGVYFIPAFSGFGAPYWDNEARAAIVGMTRGTTSAHIIRAAEESIAYQIKDVLELMTEDLDIELKVLRADGGPARDNFLMQFQSDILGISVERNKISEVSALGSTFLAGLAIGIWKSKNEISKLRQVDRIFVSQMSEEKRIKLYKGWKEAVMKIITNKPQKEEH